MSIFELHANLVTVRVGDPRENPTGASLNRLSPRRSVITPSSHERAIAKSVGWALQCTREVYG
jgi:hypothetical protein